MDNFIVELQYKHSIIGTRHLPTVPRKGERIEITDKKMLEAAGEKDASSPMVLIVTQVWWTFTPTNTIAAVILD